MTTITEFHSTLARWMYDFVSFKRMEGYDYTDQARTLSYFDSFLLEGLGQEQGPGLALSTLQRYVDTTNHLKPFSRSTRISSVREFTRYLHARQPNSAIVPKNILPRIQYTIRFFPITPRQVADLMDATAAVLPKGSILIQSVRVLIGLLYSTGLRISEALALTLDDIDQERSTLHVVCGKFGKERLVPISPSTLSAVDEYLTIRDSQASNSSSAPLFLAAYDTTMNRGQAYHYFKRLCQHCEIQGNPSPRLHDLRHNYACRRLALWRKEGKDINAMLPVLATAMGHVNIFATQRYLHADAVSLLDASEKFNHYIIQN